MKLSTNHLKSVLYWLLMSCLVIQTGCLKTRSQIRSSDNNAEDADSAEETKAGNAPRPAKRYELEEIKQELTRVSGKVEEVEHSQRSVNTVELRDAILKLDNRINDLEKNQVLIMAEIKTIKDNETEKPSPAARSNNANKQTPGDVLVEANQLLHDKNFDEAAEKFKQITNKTNKGKEASDAFFGLGECEYGQKNYKKAIVQYSKVQEANAKSPKVATSLYKIALSFQHLNMPKEAQGFFSELIERFPKSAEAKKSRAKVKE